MKNAIYHAALYIRLSKDDGDKIESYSVSNQRDLLDDYISKHIDINIYDYYIDDGFTGINFDRPDFQRMITDIENKKVNCVIVKDSSRFGRDYIDVGRYVEKYFPPLGVRFISVNENYDTQENKQDLIMPIRNIFNDQYSRDISKKVQSAFYTKQKKGDFIGAFACYGYMKDPNNKNKLIIDEYASKIVKRIFDLFTGGKGKIKISNILNAEKIPCPSEYKKQSGLNYTNGKKLAQTNYWTYSTIQRILTNEMYIGNMVQHKNNRSDFKTKKNTVVLKEEWTIVPNTHEAIISEEKWDQVQSLLQKDTRQIDFNNIHVFAGFLKCGDCGRAMSKIDRHNKIEFVCGSYKRLGIQICSQHRIEYPILEKIVLTRIRAKIDELLNFEKAILNGMPKNRINLLSIQQQIEKVQKQLDKIYLYKKGLYEDYKDGMLNKNDYLKNKQDYDNQEEQLQNQLDSLIKNKEENPEDIITSQWFLTFKKYRNVQELDRCLLADLINSITIYENKRVHIDYKFAEEESRLREAI